MKSYITIIKFVVLGIVIVLAYVGYQSYERKQQEVVDKSNAEFAEKIKIRQQKNEEYLTTIKLLCNNPVTELTGVEFYRCNNIENRTFTGVDPLSENAWIVRDAKEILEKPNLPIFCQRKISGMTANEFIECLEELEEPLY
jgi:hypothetical protein